MSKTTADVAKLLSASNEQLYDRYINVTLMQEEGGITQASHSYTPGLAQPEAIVEADFMIKTPKAGMKPHIAITGQFVTGENAPTVTLTIYNINENVDTMAYNYAEVEVGYMNSGIHVTFKGQIINCYMAKPNPNGELVVTINCSKITDLYAHGDVVVDFTKDEYTTRELLETAVLGITDTVPALKDQLLYTDYTAIPSDWKEAKFKVIKGKRFFRSAYEVITWLNSLFANYAYPAGFVWGAGGVDADIPTIDGRKKSMPPMKLGFDLQGQLRITGAFSEGGPANVKALSAIMSAFLNGEAATVAAPFNPGIMPGDIVFIDMKYFKTRVNIVGQTRELYKSLGNLWFVTSIQFTFDTMTTNKMTLLVNNLSNKIKASEG